MDERKLIFIQPSVLGYTDERGKVKGGGRPKVRLRSKDQDYQKVTSDAVRVPTENDDIV
jgi:hypothetical protein